MNDSNNQIRLRINQLFSFAGIAFLLIALGACYSIKGAEFSLLVASGVLLGFLAAMMGVLSKRSERFRFSIRGMLIVITAIAVLAAWNQHLLVDVTTAVERIEHLGGEAEVYDDPNGQQQSHAMFIRQEIKPRHLNYLRSLPNLKKLDLDYTKVGDAGMSYVATLTELEWLDIEDTGITDDGLKCLSNLKNLKKIIVDGNDVTDDGLMNLASNKSLASVRLLNTKVSPQGIRDFNQILPQCRVTIDSNAR